MITANANSKYRWDTISKMSEAGFLRLIGKHLKNDGVKESSQMITRVVAAAKQIFQDNKSFITDKPSQFHLLLTSYVLAAVESLSAIMPEEEAQRITSDCFKRNGRAWIKWSTKIGLMFSRDKFNYLLRTGGEGTRKGFGNGFEIDLITDNHTYLTTVFRKCGFHEFFKRNDKPHLTQLMCAWDDNWSDVVNSYAHLSFERPKTIAAGCDCCEFKYRSKT